MKREETVGDEIDIRLSRKNFSVSWRCLGSGGLVIFVRERFDVLVVRTG